LARLGIPEDATVIGYVSSLSHYEGVDDLMKAYQLLEGQIKTEKLALLVVGDGKEFEKLLSLKDSLGATTMHLVGKVNHSEVRQYYSIIDIFVVPRKPYEVCELVPPLKPLEAMALEKCLVVSDVRALRELALESGCVKTFRAGNLGSLVEVLSGLVFSPAERQAMGQAARRWVERNRAWDANVKLYERLYDRIKA
jgi:glycosyltransferase involved in cell wall biosynthesis